MATVVHRVVGGLDRIWKKESSTIADGDGGSVGIKALDFTEGADDGFTGGTAFFAEPDPHSVRRWNMSAVMPGKLLPEPPVGKV